MASAVNENCCIVNCALGGLFATRSKIRYMYGIEVSIDSCFSTRFEMALFAVFHHWEHRLYSA